MASGEKNLGSGAPPSRVSASEWQGKDLRDRECVRVANTGLTERHFCACVAGEGANDARREARGERVMRGENAEIDWGGQAGIGGSGSENEMGWSESEAGSSLAITTHFTRLTKRGNWPEGQK